MDKTQYNLMISGKNYKFDKYLFHLQHVCFKKVKRINNIPFDSKHRDKLLRKLFNEYGENNVLKHGFKCNFGFNISIGSNCYFNYNLTILDSAKVIIGNNVFIGPNVVITPVNHPNEAKNRKNLISSKVTIEDDVWIGANAVILPGVTLHKGCIVGANSLVKKDVQENEIVGGTPARVIGKADN